MAWMSEDEAKVKFASIFWKTKNAVESIEILCELLDIKNQEFKLKAFRVWPHDPIVMEELDRLDNLPPEKNKVSRRLADIVLDKKTDPSDAAKAAEVLGKLEGWIKPPTTIDGKRSGQDKLHELASMIIDPVAEKPIEVTVEANITVKDETKDGIIQ